LFGRARAALAADERFVFARRTITGGGRGCEDHLFMPRGVLPARGRPELRLWSAHGLDYGLPTALADVLAQGQHVVANGSRAAVAEDRHARRQLRVIEITAPRERGAAPHRRGRESADDVARRLARVTPPLRSGRGRGSRQRHRAAEGTAKLSPPSSGMARRHCGSGHCRSILARSRRYLPAAAPRCRRTNILSRRIEISEGKSARARSTCSTILATWAARDGLSRSAFAALAADGGP